MRFVIGDRTAVRCFSPVRHCDPASRCCFAHARDACRRLHLRPRRHFGQYGRRGDRNHRPRRCTLPRAQTSSPYRQAWKLEFVLFFFGE